MVDLQTQYLKIKEEIDEAIQNVLDSTAFIHGPEVDQFADALGKYVGAKAVVPCANGTDALQIAMMALGLELGDEVILPVHTYVATAEVLALLGLKPIFVDVKPDSFNIDLDQITARITNRTKAIVPVHLYGQCCDMELLLKIAERHNLFVIEDAAQALGAEYTFADGVKKKAGTMGIIGTTSFFPSKNLGCFGDGGAIFTDDENLASRIKMIANHGQQKKYHHDLIGVNSRLDTIQAAVLSVKLKYLNSYSEARNAAANFYDHALKDVVELEVPKRSAFSTHVFHQYTLQAKHRDRLKDFLATASVPTMIYYPVPLHLQKAYKLPGIGVGSFPVTEALSNSVLSLPIHTEMTEQEQSFICDQIKLFYNNG